MVFSNFLIGEFDGKFTPDFLKVERRKNKMIESLCKTNKKKPGREIRSSLRIHHTEHTPREKKCWIISVNSYLYHGMFLFLDQ